MDPLPAFVIVTGRVEGGIRRSDNPVRRSRSPIDPLSYCSHDDTCLHIAAQRGPSDRQLLVKAGLDVNKQATWLQSVALRQGSDVILSSCSRCIATMSARWHLRPRFAREVVCGQSHITLCQAPNKRMQRTRCGILLL